MAVGSPGLFQAKEKITVVKPGIHKMKKSEIDVTLMGVSHLKSDIHFRSVFNRSKGVDLTESSRHFLNFAQLWSQLFSSHVIQQPTI